MCRDSHSDSFLDGDIQLYDKNSDCFILMNGTAGVQYAVHFNQFTVEEEQNQLVLKKSLPIPLPAAAEHSHNDADAHVEQQLEVEMELDDAEEVSSYWGSPVKAGHHERMAAAASVSCPSGIHSPAAEPAFDAPICQNEDGASSSSSFNEADIDGTFAARTPAHAAVATEEHAGLDFTIPAVMDVHPRPASRQNSLRSSRERLLNLHTEATDEGMLVILPQPLSSRRMSRTSIRNAYMPSDPGFAGSISNPAELRRTLSNANGPTSRRISRTISSRINADQDWAVATPEGYAAHLMQQPQQGFPLHVPAPASRRASRTLSGRLLDQDGAPLAQLDDAVPDVLARPVTATSAGLEPIMSRHHSNTGRDTPDSDELGFGFSEGIEPLVPPELAQQAALVEAAQQLAAQPQELAAAGAGLMHSRSHRRSHRSIPTLAPVLQHRGSDQDDHNPLAATAAAATAASGLTNDGDLHCSLLGNSVAAEAVAEAMSLQSAEQQYEQLALMAEGQQAWGVVAPAFEGQSACEEQQAAAAPLVGTAQSETRGNIARSRSGSLSGPAIDSKSRRNSRHHVSGILQAAVAAVEGVVGFALGSRNTSVEQQELQAAAAAAAAIDGVNDHAQQAELESANERQHATGTEYVDIAAGVNLKEGRGEPDSFSNASSFSCPAFVPLAGADGVKSSLNPFADSHSFSFGVHESNAGSAAFQIGTVPVEALEAVQSAATAAAEPADGDSMGSPVAGSAVMLRRLLPPAATEGSEWGSGALLGSHVMSGIDSPTGSAVFKSHMFEGADSGELSTPELSFSAGPTGGGVGKSGALGSSRMGREAAAALSVPYVDSGTETLSSLRTNVSIHEITPASDDSGDGAAAEVAYSSLPRAVAASSGGASTGAVGVSGRARSSTGTGSSSTPGAPPSYADSTGAEADDECSPLADFADARRVWPAEYALGVAAEGIADDADKAGIRAAVRHGAALDNLAADRPGPGALMILGNSSLPRVSNSQVTEAAGSAPVAEAAAPVTGLVKRNVSRANSQGLLAEAAVPALDGIVMLGGSGSYQYEDDAHQPLVKQQQNVLGATTGQVAGSLGEARTQIWRVMLEAFLANCAQWYDLIAMVVLGGQLMAAMASQQWSQHQQLCLLFAVFALGHVLWVPSCILWPWVRSRSGRGAVLGWTVSLAAFPTALLGCMPSYAEGGAIGLAIIALLRFLSGLSAGSTAPSSMVYLAEHVSQLPCLHTSLVPCAMAAGACGASAVALFFSCVLPASKLGVIGWRLVLVGSLLVNGVSGVLRGRVLQDPEQFMSAAEVADRRGAYCFKFLRQHFKQVVVAAGLSAHATTGLYLLTAWMPVYYIQLTGLSASKAFTLQTVNTALLALSIPLGGLLADTYGQTTLLLATAAATAAFGYPAWLLFEMNVPAVRSSAMVFVFVLPMVLVGSVAPLMALGFVMKAGSLAGPAYVNIIMSVVTAMTVLATQRYHMG
eukprot:gene5448-5681_t